MTELGLAHVADTQIAAFILVLSRVGALFVLAPVFSARMIPLRAKLMVAVAISFALVPVASRSHEVPVETTALAGLVLKEMIVGGAFAFAIGVLGAAVQAGASLLDTLIGFSFGAVLDPISNQQNAVLGQVYSLFTATIFIVSGGVELVVMGLARSYEVVPIDSYPTAATLAHLATNVFAQVLVIALEVAAPPLVALLVADAAFGLVARAVPQMNVFIVGLPAKILVGLAAIAASLPFLAGHLSGDLDRVVQSALQGMGGR